jgi:hypothetical protein
MSHEEIIRKALVDIILELNPLACVPYENLLYVDSKLRELYTTAFYRGHNTLIGHNKRAIIVCNKYGQPIREFNNGVECWQTMHVSKHTFYKGLKTGLPTGKYKHIYKYKL